MITSASNQHMKYLVKLQKKARARKEDGVFVAEGRKMVYEAFGLGLTDKIYVSKSYFADHKADQLSSGQAVFSGNGFEIVEDKVLGEVSDTKAPQGIMAVVRMPHYSLDTLWQTGRDQPLYLVLMEDLRDPGNLGTIMRTAEGSGVDAVILSQGSVDLFNPKTVRATMGSIFRVPFFYAEDFLQMLQQLRNHGIHLFAAHLRGESWYDEEDYQRDMAIVIGNEANGISEEAAQLCHAYTKIPMEGKLESLNASAAAAILMYEVYRQRRNGKLCGNRKK